MSALSVNAQSPRQLRSGTRTIEGAATDGGGTHGSLFVQRSGACLCWVAYGQRYAARGINPAPTGRATGSLWSTPGGVLRFALDGQQYDVQETPREFLSDYRAEDFYDDPGGGSTTRSRPMRRDGTPFVVPAGYEFRVTLFHLGMRGGEWGLFSSFHFTVDAVGLNGDANGLIRSGSVEAPIAVLSAGAAPGVTFTYNNMRTYGLAWKIEGYLIKL